MEDKNYCPVCHSFLPSEPHKATCELRHPVPTEGPVKNAIIMDTDYRSISNRMAIMIEEALHRGRKVQAVTITSASADDFYGSIFWTEGQ